MLFYFYFISFHWRSTWQTGVDFSSITSWYTLINQFWRKQRIFLGRQRAGRWMLMGLYIKWQFVCQQMPEPFVISAGDFISMLMVYVLCLLMCSLTFNQCVQFHLNNTKSLLLNHSFILREAVLPLSLQLDWKQHSCSSKTLAQMKWEDIWSKCSTQQIIKWKSLQWNIGDNGC